MGRPSLFMLVALTKVTSPLGDIGSPCRQEGHASYCFFAHMSAKTPNCGKKQRRRHTGDVTVVASYGLDASDGETFAAVTNLKCCIENMR